MKNVNINEKRQQRAVNTKNIAMLELSDRYFKVAIIKVLQRWITKKSWNKMKIIKYLSKDRENILKIKMKNLELKIQLK